MKKHAQLLQKDNKPSESFIFYVGKHILVHFCSSNSLNQILKARLSVTDKVCAFFIDFNEFFGLPAGGFLGSGGLNRSQMGMVMSTPATPFASKRPTGRIRSIFPESDTIVGYVLSDWNDKHYSGLCLLLNFADLQIKWHIATLSVVSS